MPLLFLSFIAGVLTVLAPCTLPLLPIIIGGSVQDPNHKYKPYIITGSLVLSLVLFTLLVKVSTLFINLPAFFWSTLSGAILIIVGLVTLFPKVWNKFAQKFHLNEKSEKAMVDSAKKKTIWGDVLVGLSLGPVFSSCSPTYFLILATVIPQDFSTGLVYLIAYAVGLSLVLLLIALLGQRIVQKLKWAANPNGWFKRIIGILFLLIGVFILTGLDKKIQTYFVTNGYFDFSTKIEQQFLQ